MQLLYVCEGKPDRWLLRALRQVGHVVEVGDWGSVDADEARDDGCDLIIADVARPDPARMTGFLGRIATLIVADAALPSERAAVLRAGADACLTRPLHLIEVESQLTAILRMSDRLRTAPQARAGLVFDRNGRKLALGERRVVLSAQEFRLIAYLFRRTGEIVTVERLDSHLHGEAGEPRPDQIRAMLTRLRRKLRDGLGAELIHNVRGHGYVLRLDSQ